MHAHIPAQALCVAVKDGAGHAAKESALDVHGRIVHEKALLRLERKAAEQQPVYLRLGLYQTLVGGDKSSVKKFAAGNQRPVIMLAKAGVGEEKKAVSRVFQLLHQLINTLDGENWTIPLVGEAVYSLMQPLRQAPADALRRFLFRHAAPVHPGPFQREKDLLQKHFAIVPGKTQPLYEAFPVKADEHVAHVKNNVFYH